MASVSKRESDKLRGKAGKWTCYWKGADGKTHSKVGTTDKAESLRIATKLEDEATRIREGTLDPAERGRRQAALLSVADHIQAYREDLQAKGDTAKHVTEFANLLTRLLNLASITSVADLAPDRIRAALGKLTASRKPGSKKSERPASARTRNKYLSALKAFAQWLEDTNRIDEVPRGLAALRPYNQSEDRRLVRRALTLEELDRLLEAAEQGPPIESIRGPGSRRKNLDPAGSISGPERAMLDRVAMGTGFRAEELRTLTPERFDLVGELPTITVLACYAKNGKEAVQPIATELARRLVPFLEGKEPGKPWLAVPVRTAKMLRKDLEAAGIPFRDGEGRVLDFHSLRGSFITHMVNRGINPKTVQTLARHSSITLTLDRYTTVDRDDVRKALEGEKE